MRVIVIICALHSTLAFAAAPPGKWPTQAEAQAELDSYFAQADRVVFSEIVGARESFTTILTVYTPGEIAQTNRCFRLVMNDSEEVLEIDGQPQGRYLVKNCGCYGWFRMELYRGDHVILDAYLHGSAIASAAIRTEGLIDLDPEAHEPLMDRLVSLLQEPHSIRFVWEEERRTRRYRQPR